MSAVKTFLKLHPGTVLSVYVSSYQDLGLCCSVSVTASKHHFRLCFSAIHKRALGLQRKLLPCDEGASLQPYLDICSSSWMCTPTSFMPSASTLRPKTQDCLKVCRSRFLRWLSSTWAQVQLIDCSGNEWGGTTTSQYLSLHYWYQMMIVRFQRTFGSPVCRM